jgi:hypothetical protein
LRLASFFLPRHNKKKGKQTMPSRVWSHLCDYATIDANGKPTIVGDFDRINANSVPIQFPLFFVISKWNGYSGEYFTHRVRVVSPSGQEISSTEEVNVMIQAMGSGDGNHVNIDSFMMMQLHEFGEYAIEILLNGDPVHILALMVDEIHA